VLLQGYPNLEYFVLDGGSTDNSVEVIRRYAPWITYWVSEPDGGQSAAITQGLRMGSGLFATWINSDDMLYRDAIVSHASQVGFSPRTVYVGISAYMDSDGHVIAMHRGKIYSLKELVRFGNVWRAGGHIVQPEVLFPRELALEVGGLNTRNHRSMDYELWGKFFLAGAHFHYTDIPFGMFRRHAGQKTRDRWQQTQSSIETAAHLVAIANCLSAEEKKKILGDLNSYRREYRRRVWRGSGRLARAGVPPQIVMLLRKLRLRIQHLRDRLM
jgi:glycosyltransferase involved in cell wall biosynthesis